MGKGTKHARDWAETTLQVVIDAEDFYIHSVRIMGNPKKFNPSSDFNNETLYMIQREAMHLLVAVRTANKINVTKEPDRAEDRLSLQREALTSCDLLETYLRLSRRQFHLDADKFWAWFEKLDRVAGKLAAWHKSDRGRFADAARHPLLSSLLADRACGDGEQPVAVKEVRS